MCKKILVMISILLFSFLTINSNVYAEYHVLDKNNGTEIDYNNIKTCEGILGDVNDKKSVAFFLQQIFNVFKYGGPILCIVLTILEFVKAVSSQDKDFLAKAMTRTGKRIVYALLLFFIPTLINFLFGLFGWYGTCGIS